ncbi:MAG: HU family DNA-binding protein [Desulfuromonadales bacterium]|uniref:HU family DNA-binding protein n=1 Tax=unclassified Desulfuromonas TaxID=2614637 RepID=UPI00032653A7|nr:HU family DNA-binding protein [Desulfuromonas sp. AOP6]MCP3178266.1 HU family DNA-binding protein [Desulfuromonas sp. KJ2020]MDW7646203.1 HU family DNA-binding protein [Desulfuromonadales bacterium]MDW7758093.1 HU family DNA-binding protein [Desulfuromonadales bacterium]BCA79371.1 DNA-binding protein HU-beta [Desulfuromonas sp. AOP6]
MTKADLVNAMAEKAGLSKADAEKALKAFTDAVTDALKAGEKVALVGFGTFSVGERAARTGQNPQTGAKIQIAAAKMPKFKAGKALKDSVN